MALNTITRRLASTPCIFCRLHPSRSLHARTSPPPIPSPTPFVPDVATFLKLIGRGMSSHASKIPDWKALFSLDSDALEELGVQPARSRKYLLWWRDRFRNGIAGPGSDLKYVRDGEATLKVVEVPIESKKDEGTRKEGSVDTSMVPRTRSIVVNEPTEDGTETEEMSPVEGMTVRGAGVIVGPWISHVKGSRGRVVKMSAQEGMWEVKQGVKVDGGERRKKQVRRKRLLDERRTTRA